MTTEHREPSSPEPSSPEPGSPEPAAGGSASDDRLWVQAAASYDAWIDGDQAGLDALVALVTPVLWHVVRSYRLEQSVAEDVVQTTWLTLLRRRDTIRDSRAIGGWLTTTARREAWRVARTESRTDAVEPEQLDVRLPSAGSAESTAVEHDRARRVWAAVEGLNERCRRLLRIVAFEDRPDYARISTELGMPVGSIGPTRGRCLDKLHAALAATGDLR